MHISARHLKRGPFRYVGILPGAAILMTASCACCGKECPKRIEIIPDAISVAPGQELLLGTRLYDNLGLMAEKTGRKVHWDSDPHVSLSNEYGAETRITVPATLDRPITLTATVGDVEGTATISLAKSGESTMDWGASPDASGGRPTLALITGRIEPEWRADTLVAFAGAGQLDKFLLSSTQPGEVTVFSPLHELQQQPVGWTDPCDVLMMQEGAGPPPSAGMIPACASVTGVNLPPPVLVAFQISALMGDVDPSETISVHVDYAVRRLGTGWSGIQLAHSPVTRWPEKAILLELTPNWECVLTGVGSVQDQLRDAGLPNALFGPGKINVFYAPSVAYHSPAWPEVVTTKGYTCQWDRTLGTIAFVSVNDAVESTLAHELGHAIGPPLLHTTEAEGFNESNLMWQYAWAVPGARQIVTLGQAFRLSRDGNAFRFKNVNPPPQPQCPQDTDEAAPLCPRLSKDVIKQ